MSSGIIVLVAAVVAGVLLSVLKTWYDGRFRAAPVVRSEVVEDRISSADVGTELGERATLLQFSSAFCAPCRVTRRVLGEVADVVPGVVHVEVDAEHHLELVRRLGIVRTPTTLILDSTGLEVSRATGAPSRDAVLGVLARVLDD